MSDASLPVPAGIDAASVTEWLCTADPAAQAPLNFELIAGGHSNLTFRVTSANDRRYALRRPPLGHVLATAHDMGREHRILAALQSTEVPVPRLVGLCDDVSVNDAPFYVMHFVEGVVIRDHRSSAAIEPALRADITDSLVDTLVKIHEVDVDAVGLGELGRKDGYVARQLKRWRTQWHASKTRELASIDEVHDILIDRIPFQQGSGIVHGDYRLDNCIYTADGQVAAVIDWELCTLGDVLADLAQLLVYWSEPTDAEHALDSPPTAEPGYGTRDAIIARYASKSLRDLSELDFYLAFTNWKVACILEGVYSRYLHGAMGDKGKGLDVHSFKRRVELLAERAAAIATHL